MKIKNLKLLKESDNQFQKLLNMREELSKSIFGEKIDSYRDSEGYDFVLYERNDDYIVRRESEVWGTAKVIGEYDKSEKTLDNMVGIIKEMSGNNIEYGVIMEGVTPQALQDVKAFHDVDLEDIFGDVNEDGFRRGLKISRTDIGRILKQILPAKAWTDENKEEIINILNNFYKEKGIDVFIAESSNLETAMSDIVDELPDMLSGLASETGDKDGQLEPKEQINEGLLTLMAGLSLSAPKIMQLMGTLAKQLNKKVDSKVLGNVAEWLEDNGHRLHEKYEQIIYKIIEPLTKGMDDATRQKVSKGIFVGIIALMGLNAATTATAAIEGGDLALGGVEAALTKIKGSELAPLVKRVLPKVLSQTIK